MARSLIHHLSTRERERERERKRSSVGVGVGGLVSLDVIDREYEASATATAAATAAASAASAASNHGKLSLRKSFIRNTLTLTVPSSRNVVDSCPTPSPVVNTDSPLSSPSSACKSGVSSRVSTAPPSTVATPQSPLNKPLPPRPPRPSSPGLPSLPELPGSLPGEPNSLSAPVGTEEAMGILVPDPAVMAQAQGFDIQRPKTTIDMSSSGVRVHRRNRSDNAAVVSELRDTSPTPRPLFAQDRNLPLTRGETPVMPPRGDNQQAATTSSAKKRKSSGHPVKTAYPMTPEDVGRHRAATTDTVQMDRDRLSHGLHEAQGQIEAALTQLSRSQANERMLKAQLNALQARLEDSNSQRVDALEQNLFLEERLQHLFRIQNHLGASPAGPASVVESRPTSRLLAAEERVQVLEQRLAAAQDYGNLAVTVTELSEQVEQYQFAMQDKDQHIRGLEQRNNALKMQLQTFAQRLQAMVQTSDALTAGGVAQMGLLEAQDAASARLLHLEQTTAEQKAQLATVCAEKSQLQGLLEVETRRQAVLANKLEHPNASQLGAFGETEQTVADIKSRVSRKAAIDAPGDAHDSASLTPEQQIRQLTREVEYHVQDIVLYKLDVKGYKKDLKRANAKIKKLTDAENARQMLSPGVAAPAASPSPSFVSVANSSAPSSAHPGSPSPGPRAAVSRGPFPPPPPLQPPTSALPPVPTGGSSSSGGRQTTGVVTPPPAPFKQFAARSTPTTPTNPHIPQRQNPTRQRSHTGPARSFAPPEEPAPAATSTTMVAGLHHRAHSDVSPAAHLLEAAGRVVAVRVEGPSSTESPAVPVNSQTPRAEGKPPMAIEAYQGACKGPDAPRNSLQAYGDVPNGGLPPIQMWCSK